MLPRRTTLAVLLAAALALPAVPAQGQTKDPFVGTWQLDRSKSDFDPPQPFQRRTLTIEEADGGFTYRTRTISDRLQATETSFTGPVNGTDLPIDGSALDSYALKRVNATTIERTGKLKDTVVETATMQLSRDGKTLTLTIKGSVDGRSYSSTQVFLRQ